MLSKERIAELKIYFTRCVQSRSLSTVVHLAECGLELIEEVIAREKQIEQLQAQVARMREALEYYADIKRWGEVNLIYVPSPDKARKALSATPADYHNPSDVEALRKARKALYAARVDVLTKETDELAREALAEIDKVLGGKDDA